MVKPHTSDTRMTYEYIGVTCGWHMSTYEWHTDDIRVHTSDIRMTYEYIRVTYGWHTSIYEWHTDDIRAHTSDIRMTHEGIWVTYKWHFIRMAFEWHTDDMWFERKIKLSFLKLFENSFSEYLICKKIPSCFGLINKIIAGSGINFCCTFSAWFLHTNAAFLIIYQLTKFQSHIFFTRYQTKCVINFLLRQLMTS